MLTCLCSAARSDTSAVTASPIAPIASAPTLPTILGSPPIDGSSALIIPQGLSLLCCIACHYWRLFLLLISVLLSAAVNLPIPFPTPAKPPRQQSQEKAAPEEMVCDILVHDVVTCSSTLLTCKIYSQLCLPRPFSTIGRPTLSCFVMWAAKSRLKWLATPHMCPSEFIVSKPGLK